MSAAREKTGRHENRARRRQVIERSSEVKGQLFCRRRHEMEKCGCGTIESVSRPTRKWNTLEMEHTF